MRHISNDTAPILRADLVELRAILGDCIEAIDQLDMARESGGVVSHEVMSRLRRVLAKPSDVAQKAGG